MTKAVYTRTPTGFAPKDEAGRKYWDRFTVGDNILLTFTLPRSLPQLNLFWKLAEIAAANNKDQLATKEQAGDCIKMACGLVEVQHIKFNGEWFERKKPLSIAFENMEQKDFNAFFEKALAYVCAELVPGLDPVTLQQEVECAA
jgi:hypothetical protein